MREVKREREGVREVKTEGRPELNCSSCEAWLPGGKFNYRYVVLVVVVVGVVVGVVVVAVVTLEKKYSKFIFQKLYILCVQCIILTRLLQ